MFGGGGAFWFLDLETTTIRLSIRTGSIRETLTDLVTDNKADITLKAKKNSDRKGAKCLHEISREGSSFSQTLTEFKIAQTLVEKRVILNVPEESQLLEFRDVKKR